MRNNIIKSAHHLLINNFNLHIRIGVEVEFYSDLSLYVDNSLFSNIEDLAKEHFIYINNIKTEKGLNQFEIDINFNDPEIISDQITILKKILIDQGMILGAKPFSDRPGSALHFNISLHNLDGKNILDKKDEAVNDLLSYSIGGLLELANQSMIFFAPNELSYRRFDKTFEVPSKICWGGNNRTVALRVLKNLDNNVRIEHRIAGVDCNHYYSITAIIFSIYHGIKNKINAPVPIYGNAFEAKYDLPLISKSYQESLNHYNEGKGLKEYFYSIVSEV